MDETVILRVGALAKQLNTSKKKIIENAVEMYAAMIDEEQESDLLEQTSGAWRRDKPAGQVVGQARDSAPQWRDVEGEGIRRCRRIHSHTGGNGHAHRGGHLLSQHSLPDAGSSGEEGLVSRSRRSCDTPFPGVPSHE